MAANCGRSNSHTHRTGGLAAWRVQQSCPAKRTRCAWQTPRTAAQDRHCKGTCCRVEATNCTTRIIQTAQRLMPGLFDSRQIRSSSTFRRAAQYSGDKMASFAHCATASERHEMPKTLGRRPASWRDFWTMALGPLRSRGKLRQSPDFPRGWRHRQERSSVFSGARVAVPRRSRTGTRPEKCKPRSRPGIYRGRPGPAQEIY
jgi:hypothetical protein